MAQIHKIYSFLFASFLLTLVLFVFSLISPSPNHFFALLFSVFLCILLLLNGVALLITHTSSNDKTSTNSEAIPAPATTQPHSLVSEHEEKLKDDAILASIGEGLVIIDNHGKIVTFNKAAETLLGWTAQEALGKNLSDIVKIDYENMIQVSKQALGNRSTLYFIRKDKTKFPAEIITSSYIEGDTVLGTITLFRDVTAEREMDKMKNEFISLASHQLRTPLAAIRWYSKMLLDGDAGKLQNEQLEYAQSINTTTERMIDLVNSLLNITRIESGRIMVEPQPTDLKQMVTEVLNEVKIRFMDKKQKFNLDIQGEIPSISVDPRLVRQVYINLLTNAAKYTSENGEIKITISKNATEITSEIKDNGVGIPENEQEKVFGKFFRGENLVNGDNSGTGLGLYLVKAIIELSKGKIWFKSQAGKGTSFWFSLPLAGTPAKKGVLSLET